ncbi:hypothetical protein RGUI_2840 [Rhodovulum sp. P5]|nr:hypothetical protein RGUI_2840 [Rhodovulum sp. P5]
MTAYCISRLSAALERQCGILNLLGGIDKIATFVGENESCLRPLEEAYTQGCL